MKPPKIQTKLPTGRILYFTDKFGVSQGYEPAFTKMVERAKIPRQRIMIANINSLVDKPLVKYRNEKTLRFNPDRKLEIQKAVDVRIQSIKPSLIVCSDPVALGLFTKWDQRVSTLDKCRGGVYKYQGIPVIVTLPVTAIHRNIDERLVKDFASEEDVVYEPYRIPQGSWILARDWEKISRFYHGKERRLPDFQYSITRTLADCYAAREWLLGCSAIAVDIETACFPAQITCIGYTGIRPDGKVRTFVIPFFDEYQDDGCFWPNEDDHAVAYSVCRDINESEILKVLQNGNYDASYFIRDRLGLKNFLLDTMLMWYSIYMELPKSLDFISSILLDVYQYWKDDIKGAEEKDEIQGNMEKYWRYNGLDTYFTLFNALYMLRLLNTNTSMQHNYRDVYMRSVSALHISMRGVKKDDKRLAKHRNELTAQSEAALKRFRYLIADDSFNVNSPDQKTSLLYDVLGAKPRNAKGRVLGADAKDSPSSGAIALKAIKSEHPIFKYVVGALESSMEPDKQMGLITGRWQEDGTIKGGIKYFTDRFRTCYGAAGTTSTRFSSKGSNFWDGTNAQNIRSSMRDFLVADPGCILMDVDYSQSDDVFVGYESNDANKIAVIESGVDGHAVHGELFFKMPYDEIVAGKRAGDPKIVHPIFGVRQLSKRIVHGCLLPMAEVMTRSGWKRIDQSVEGEEAMTWSPSGVMEWQPAQLYVGNHEGQMVKFETQSAELTMTPDHNMWTVESGRGKARNNYRKRITIPTAGLCEGEGLSVTRLQIALMADGSQAPSGMWQVALKKRSKVERFKLLCEEAGVKWNVNKDARGYWRFHVWGADSRKHWTLDLLDVPLARRRELIEESSYWDGDRHGNGIRFFTADKYQADHYMAIASCSGFSASLTQTIAGEASFNPGGIVWVVGLTRKFTRGIRKERWSIQNYSGKVYCLLVPNNYFLVRQNGRVSITGNTNFQMAAITLYMTMGRDAVVAAMTLMGYPDASRWSQDQLIHGCQILMNTYRKKYPRLTQREWYKEIADLLRTKGVVTNAFGIARRFLGDPNDSGTQREATGFIGQSDTAGNMNRSMYEIDHGFIPERFRDGDNPDFGDTPRRMSLDSHGFRFLLQTHDSFTAQLSLDHPRFEEACNNLLHVMERPVIINGHTVRVKTEAGFGLRWGKKMIEWNPAKSSLSDIVTQALAADT